MALVSVPEEVGIVVEGRVLRDAVDLPASDGKRVVLASRRGRVLRDELVPIPRGNRLVRVVDDDLLDLRGRGGANARGEDLLAGAAERTARVQPGQELRARVEPLPERFEGRRETERREVRLLHHVFGDRLEGPGDVLLGDRVTTEHGSRVRVQELPRRRVHDAGRFHAVRLLKTDDRLLDVAPESPVDLARRKARAVEEHLSAEDSAARSAPLHDRGRRRIVDDVYVERDGGRLADGPFLLRLREQ